MLSGLDPIQVILIQRRFAIYKWELRRVWGFGIEVGTQDGLIRVVAPIEDTPAARAV